MATIIGRTVIRYPDTVYTIIPDGDIIDTVLANPGIDVRAYLDWLVSVRDARVSRVARLPTSPPAPGDTPLE